MSYARKIIRMCESNQNSLKSYLEGLSNDKKADLLIYLSKNYNEFGRYIIQRLDDLDVSDFEDYYYSNFDTSDEFLLEDKLSDRISSSDMSELLDRFWDLNNISEWIKDLSNDKKFLRFLISEFDIDLYSLVR